MTAAGSRFDAREHYLYLPALIVMTEVVYLVFIGWNISQELLIGQSIA